MRGEALLAECVEPLPEVAEPLLERARLRGRGGIHKKAGKGKGLKQSE